MKTDLSIIICTRDRAESLRATLSALGQVKVPNDLRVELVVVDNGSTDHTAEVVRDAVIPRFSIQYVYEARTGLANARNTGVSRAEGDIFLFTDDDVRPSMDWIERMCGPLLDGTTDAVEGLITIAPHLEREWLRGFLRVYVACNDQLARTGADHPLIGANMAFARYVLDKVSGFDLDLGAGSANGFGEETLFSFQLRAAGFRIVVANGGAVEHHFNEDRLRPDRFLGALYKMGRSAAYIAYHWEHRHIRSARVKLWFLACKLFVRRFVSRRPSLATTRAWEAVYVQNLGFLSAYVALMGTPRKYSKRGLKRLNNSIQPIHSIALRALEQHAHEGHS